MHSIIANIRHFIKSFKKLLSREDVFISLLIIVVSLCSFEIGKQSASENITKPPFLLTDLSDQAKEDIMKKLDKNSGASFALEEGKTTIFGSKSGTKYYFSWCSGASRVKLENRVYYATEEQAKTSGRTIAAGCR